MKTYQKPEIELLDFTAEPIADIDYEMGTTGSPLDDSFFEEL